MCTWLSSPCSGASPDGWQFWQRGETKTVQARLNAACAAAASDLAALLVAVDAARTAWTELDEVASAACCCASAGRFAARIAKTTIAIWIGHFLPKLSVMFAPSAYTLTRNANLQA